MKNHFILAMLLIFKLQQSTVHSSLPSIELTGKVVASSIHLGEALNVELALVNNTKHAIDCSSAIANSGLDEAYIYDLRTEQGSPVGRIRGKDPGSFRIGSPCSVPPGHSKEFILYNLAKVFDLREAGSYTLQVSRKLEDEPGHTITVSSSLIRITILPASKPQ